MTITDVLPADFTCTSSSTYYSDPNAESGTLPGTVSYDAATHTLTYSDPTGKTCQAPIPRVWATVQVNGTASTDGVPDPIGTTITNIATAAWTYLDGTPGSGSASLTTTVVSVVPTPFLTKAGATQSFGNAGQYVFPGNGGHYVYTYPGNWNATGQSVHYQIALTTVGVSSGADFAVEDPLPCLNNFAGGVYSSPAPGAGCTNPAFIPTLLTAANFTPTSSDSITLVYTDGTTTSVPYTSGTGWVIPTSPAVAEIDIPPFPEEGHNTSATMAFNVLGYAALSVSTTSPSLLTNTATANAYLVGSTTPLVPQETASGSVMVVSPHEPSGTVLQSNTIALYQGAGTCVEQLVQAYSPTQYLNYVEIAAAPSQPIYIDYLAPAGATVTSGQSTTFTFASIAATYTTGTITATVTPNFNGTGRTLLEWVIPVGAITTPGDYHAVQSPILVSLGAGCDGVYQNDMTIGYGAAVTGCLSGASVPNVPSNPTADSDLDRNGTPLPGNYCGSSAPLTVPAVNPAFSVNKSVQGNLDAAPIGGGGIGDVSPSGGTASYDVIFTNTGQANLTNPVMYDLLPAVGDTYATSLAGRGSQFSVALTGVGPVPAGVTVYYSTSTNPCRPQVLATNPGCVNDWSTTPPSPLSSVTALELVYTGTVYVAGGAGINGFSVPFTVSTPTTTPGQVAWNTIGTTADAGTTAMTPAESSRTGLQAQAQPTIVKATTTASYTTPGDTIS